MSGALQHPGRRQRVADRARAVIGVVDERAVPAAEPVREPRDLVAAGDDVPDHAGAPIGASASPFLGDAERPAALEPAVVALELAQVAPDLRVGGAPGLGPVSSAAAAAAAGSSAVAVRRSVRLGERLVRLGVADASQLAAGDRARDGRVLGVVLQQRGGAERGGDERDGAERKDERAAAEHPGQYRDTAEY